MRIPDVEGWLTAEIWAAEAEVTYLGHGMNADLWQSGTLPISCRNSASIKQSYFLNSSHVAILSLFETEKRKRERGVQYQLPSCLGIRWERYMVS